jgi:hypothetical protein
MTTMTLVDTFPYNFAALTNVFLTASVPGPDDARIVSKVAKGNSHEAAAFKKPGMIVTMPANAGHYSDNDEADDVHHLLPSFVFSSNVAMLAKHKRILY